MQHLKHLLLTFLLAMASAVGAWAVTAVKPAGTGTSAQPYQIATPANLLWMQQRFNSKVDADYVYLSHFVLTDDIDMSTLCSATVGNWASMGNVSSSYPFQGTFDGQGHTISNLYSHGSANCGLFAYIGTCTIKDLTLANVDIQTTGSSVGALANCGAMTEGTIPHVTNVRVTGTMTTSNRRIGAIMGDYAHGIIERCVNEANITSTYDGTVYLGGFVGSLSKGKLTITGCTNKGNITDASGSVVGGFIGCASHDCDITDCLNLGNVTGSTSYSNGVGGIIGEVNLSASGTVRITNCLNMGNVAGYNSCTYIAGNVRNGSAYDGGDCFINDCYWNADATLTRYRSGTNINQWEYCGTVGSSIGSLTADRCAGLTAAQLASGEAAFRLQNGHTNTAWGQNLAAAQPYPVPSTTNRVYANGDIDCTGHFLGTAFTNSPASGQMLDHNIVDGICTACDMCEAPTKVGDWYEVANTGQFCSFRDMCNAGNNYTTRNLRLTGDINLAAVCGPTKGNWVPFKVFNGTFDGQGHTISGLYIHTTNEGDYAGLIKEAENASTFRNIILTDVDIDNSTSSSSTAAFLARGCNGCTLEYITVRNGSIKGTHIVGAIAAQSGYSQSIHHLTNGADVTGDYEAGGIIGYLTGPGMANCKNTGNVAGNKIVGGIAARMDAASVSMCSNSGNISSAEYCAGGICGSASPYARTITDCLNTGSVTGKSDAGGIISHGNLMAISHCLNTGNVACTSSGNPSVGSIIGTVNPELNCDGCVVNSSLGIALPDGVKVVDNSQITAGAAAFILQGGRTDCVWSQKVGTDAMPQLNIDGTLTDIVYLAKGTTDCAGNVSGSVTYANTEGSGVTHKPHQWTDGYCTVCHQGEQPALVGGVYQISKAGHLVWFRDYVNNVSLEASAALTADIDLSNVCSPGHSWIPIGLSGQEESTCWKGTFDGQHHTISGLYVEGQNYMGLFAGATKSTIADLTIEGTAKGQYSVGLLAGALYKSNTITGCTARGSVFGLSTTTTNVGGLIGYSYYDGISDCVNYATVNSVGYLVGGIVGRCQSTNIQRCANYGAISADKGTVGGVAGELLSDNYKFEYCANYGPITSGNSQVGAIAGSSQSTIKSCFASCDIDSRGGLTGNIVGSGKTDNCHFESGKVFNYDGTGSFQLYTGQTGHTAQECASGAVAYALGAPFGQQLGTDALPRLRGPQVYYGAYQHANPTPVAGGESIYSNLVLVPATDDPLWRHKWDFDHCAICGKHSLYNLDDSGMTRFDWTSDNQGQSSSTSSTQVEFNANPGDPLTFHWTVDSEASCDKLTIYLAYSYTPDTPIVTFVDNASGKEQSGDVDYHFEFGGPYVLVAKYVKDHSSDKYTDTATMKGSCGEPITVSLFGDINYDYAFDLKDVNLLREMILGKTSPHDADFNKDGKVTIADFTELIRQLLMP